MTAQLFELARYATLTLTHHLRTKVGVAKASLLQTSQQASKTFLPSRGASNSSFGECGFKNYSTTIGRTDAEKVNKKERKTKGKKIAASKRTPGTGQALQSREIKTLIGKEKIFLEPNETNRNILPGKESSLKPLVLVNSMGPVASRQRSSPSRKDVNKIKPKTLEVDASVMNVGLNAINKRDVKHKNILGFDSKNKISDIHNKPLPRHPYLNSPRLALSPNVVKVRKDINKFFKSPKQKKHVVNVLEGEVKDTYGVSVAKQHQISNVAQKIEQVPEMIGRHIRSESKSPKNFREALEALKRDASAMDKAAVEEEIRTTSEKIKNIYRSLPKKGDTIWQSRPADSTNEVLPINTKNEASLSERRSCISPFNGGCLEDTYEPATSKMAPLKAKDNNEIHNIHMMRGRRGKNVVMAAEKTQNCISDLNEKQANSIDKPGNSATFIVADEGTLGHVSRRAPRERSNHINKSNDKQTNARSKSGRSETFILVDEEALVDAPHYVPLSDTQQNTSSKTLSETRRVPQTYQTSVLDKKGPHDSKYFTRPTIDEHSLRNSSIVSPSKKQPIITSGKKSSPMSPVPESKPVVQGKVRTNNFTIEGQGTSKVSKANNASVGLTHNIPIQKTYPRWATSKSPETTRHNKASREISSCETNSKPQALHKSNPFLDSSLHNEIKVSNNPGKESSNVVIDTLPKKQKAPTNDSVTAADDYSQMITSYESAIGDYLNTINNRKSAVKDNKPAENNFSKPRSDNKAHWASGLNRGTSSHLNEDKSQEEVGLNLLRNVAVPHKKNAEDSHRAEADVKVGEGNDLSTSNQNTPVKNDIRQKFQDMISEFKQKALETVSITTNTTNNVNCDQEKSTLTSRGSEPIKHHSKKTLKENRYSPLTYNARLNEYEHKPLKQPKSKKEKRKLDKQKKLIERYAPTTQKPTNNLTTLYSGSNITAQTIRPEELRSPSASSSTSSLAGKKDSSGVQGEENTQTGGQGDNSQSNKKSTLSTTTKADEVENLRKRHYNDVVETMTASSLKKRNTDNKDSQRQCSPVDPANMSKDGHVDAESKGGDGQGDFLKRLGNIDAGLSQMSTSVEKCFGPLDGWMGMTLLPMDYSNDLKKDNKEIPKDESSQEFLDDIKNILKKGGSLRDNTRHDALMLLRRELITAYKKEIRRHQQALDRYQGKLKKVEDEQRVFLKTSARAGRAL